MLLAAGLLLRRPLAPAPHPRAPLHKRRTLRAPDATDSCFQMHPFPSTVDLSPAPALHQLEMPDPPLPKGPLSLLLWLLGPAFALPRFSLIGRPLLPAGAHIPGALADAKRMPIHTAVCSSSLLEQRLLLHALAPHAQCGQPVDFATASAPITSTFSSPRIVAPSLALLSPCALVRPLDLSLASEHIATRVQLPWMYSDLLHSFDLQVRAREAEERWWAARVCVVRWQAGVAPRSHHWGRHPPILHTGQ